MRGKRKTKAALRELGRAASFDETDPTACECGHHAGLPAAYHNFWCPVRADYRRNASIVRGV